MTGHEIMDRSTQIAVFWIRCLTGSFSLLGSSTIVFMVLSDMKQKLSRPKNRFMLAMSFVDILQSVAMALSALPLPSESGNYGARGNHATCAAQRFFIFLGLTMPLYICSLNFYYLLTIRYNFKRQQFSSKIEPSLHLVSLGIPLFSAIKISFDDCQDDVTYGFLRYAPKFVSIGFLGTVSYCVCFTLFSMTSVCHAVISQRDSMKKYSYASPSRRNNQMSLNARGTTIQALMISSTFVLTSIFPLINTIVNLASRATPVSPVLTILSALFYPLQGFWNAILYIYPGVQHVQNMNPEKSISEAIKDVIFNPEAVAAPRRSYIRNRRQTQSRRVRRERNKDNNHRLSFQSGGTCTRSSLVWESLGNQPKLHEKNDRDEDTENIDATKDNKLVVPQMKNISNSDIGRDCLTQLENSAIKMESTTDEEALQLTANDTKSLHVDEDTIPETLSLAYNRRRSAIRRVSLVSIASCISFDASEDDSESEEFDEKDWTAEAC